MSGAKRRCIKVKCDSCGGTVTVLRKPTGICRKPIAFTDESGKTVHICGRCISERKEVRLS